MESSIGLGIVEQVIEVEAKYGPDVYRIRGNFIFASDFSCFYFNHLLFAILYTERVHDLSNLSLIFNSLNGGGGMK